MDVHEDHRQPISPPRQAPLGTMGPLASPLEERFHQREWSKENAHRTTPSISARKPVPVTLTDVGTRMQGGPLSPVHINSSSEYHIPEPSSTEIEEYSSYFDRSRTPSGEHRADQKEYMSEAAQYGSSRETLQQESGYENDSTYVQQPPPAVLPSMHNMRTSSPRIVTPDSGDPRYRHIASGSNGGARNHYRQTSNGSSNGSHANKSNLSNPSRVTDSSPRLQYYHNRDRSDSSNRLVNNRSATQSPRRNLLGDDLSRPGSANESTLEVGRRGRTKSPQLSPNQHARTTSSQGRLSPDNRPVSFVDLLNIPYPQTAPTANLDHAHLQVGSNASLLSTKKTLEMYRANVKKTNDPAIQYEFAVFMINAAQEATAAGQDLDEDPQRQRSPSLGRELDGSVHEDRASGANSDLLQEARHILQRLADKSYPFAQYYLADGYASGLFNKGREDNDRAFPLFVSASKHGHAEAGYRAALCYEFGWGCRSDPLKAVQFYRQSASKNHPGAMARLGRGCLLGELGLVNREREGLKWLKRAAESADFQYNAAPYELGLLHESGYRDDVFQDESYAAQLYTQSADLGHAEANYRLGDAYEHGTLHCPKDPALSIHFYTGAAQRGHPLAMMALCAWYMVGAEPILEKDEGEAYEWAKKAAECALPKAEYAVGYFTEMGIGCRRDPLEANVWYVRAADRGDDRAKHRLAAIRAAASGAHLGGQAAAAGRIPSPQRRNRKDPVGGPPLLMEGGGMGVGMGMGEKEREKEKEKEKEKKSRKWGIF
ncbi:hypothetical protein MMC19_001988 [Ptychographa xylographoides]|nr:hypothetical protein [Ptychographa xylographoides]